MMVSKIVNVLLSHAREGRSPEISIEPQEHDVRVRYRQDGILRTSLTYPIEVHSALTAFLKKKAGLNPYTHDPQTGTFSNVRFSTIPVGDQERLLLRIILPESADERLMNFGFRPQHIRLFEEERRREEKGMVLMAAPRGMGKTTTLEALRVFFHPSATNLSPHPDISLREEISVLAEGAEDPEATRIGLHASALNRHALVSVSAIHPVSAISDLSKHAPAHIVHESLNIGMTQRLVRKICQACKEEYLISEQEKDFLMREYSKLPAFYQSDSFEKTSFTAYRGRGCAQCGNTGYYGRIAIVEVFPFTRENKQWLSKKFSPSSFQKELHRHHLLPLGQDAFLKALEGVTTFEEALPYLLS